jgi:cytochrome c-type biogenesis protein CcmH
MRCNRMKQKLQIVPLTRGVVLFISLMVLLLPLNTALAGEPDPATPSDDEVNAIAKQLYCPVCENIPLDVCGTQACAQWRELIREKLSQGWDEEQIKTYFLDQYGDRVLAEPPRRGLNWLVYVIPPATFLIGIYVLYRGLRALHQEPPEHELVSVVESEPEIDDAYVAQMEEELRKLS